ncbi:hypothetical protein LCL97_14285 [Seohaeicola saemankumensis]|nr:hypothetical protein [Seohaeicola saemankumensis]MCA0872004.1 hypothetical protein [Seohaeicola saemankumensis]
MIAADANDAEVSGAFDITFPAAMLIRAGEEEEFLTGNMIGYLNGNADIDVTGPTYGNCLGSFKKSNETMQMSCENGFSFTKLIGNSTMKMSGVYAESGVLNGVAYSSAYGWGKKANKAALRAALGG